MQRLVSKKCLCGKNLRWTKEGLAQCSWCESAYSAEFGISVSEVNKLLKINNLRVIDLVDRKHSETCIVKDTCDIDSKPELKHLKTSLRLVNKKCECGSTIAWHRTGVGNCMNKGCGKVHNADTQFTIEDVEQMSKNDVIKLIDIDREVFDKYSDNITN